MGSAAPRRAKESVGPAIIGNAGQRSPQREPQRLGCARDSQSVFGSSIVGEAIGEASWTQAAPPMGESVLDARNRPNSDIGPRISL